MSKFVNHSVACVNAHPTCSFSLEGKQFEQNLDFFPSQLKSQLCTFPEGLMVGK